MNGIRFMKDRAAVLLLQLLMMVLLDLFLYSAGNSMDAVVLIDAVWAAAVTVYFLVYFYRRKRYLAQLLGLAENLEERYLVSEVMELPQRAEDRVFYQLLQLAGKSMLERVGDVAREKRDYREYIEQWVHEAKTPVTAMRLLCENNRERIPKNMFVELEKLDHYIEQALFYARSEQTHKDYLIREVVLEEAVHQSVSQNRQLLLQSHVQIQVTDTGITAFTDEKWLVFILNQLIQNAVRYKSDTPVIKIEVKKDADKSGVLLSVADNGIGIRAEELPRIFEKGFTGSNGRRTGNTTGMGLYLCRRLCDSLQIGLDVCSDGSSGTEFTLSFCQNEYVSL